MKYIVTFFSFITGFLVFGHTELFQLSNSEFSGNKLINSNFGFELKINYSAFLNIEEIGVDFFSVGEDNKAFLDLYVFEKASKKQLFFKRNYFEDIDYQNAYLSLNYFFESNKSYVFLIVNDTNVFENKDNTIAYFSPRILGSELGNRFFSASSILMSSNSSFPLSNSFESPFVHIGVTNTAMPEIINFMSTNIKQIYYSNKNSKSFTTQFKFLQDRFVTHLGLFDVDLGDNNSANLQFQLLDSHGETLKSFNSVPKNIKEQRFEVNFDYYFKKNQTYSLKITNVDNLDNDNRFLLFKPSLLPYIDSMSSIQVVSSKIDEVIDSLFLGTYFFNFVDTNYLSSKINEFKSSNYLIQRDMINKNLTITFSDNYHIHSLNCFDLTGQRINNLSLSADNKILFTPTSTFPCLYIIKVNSDIIKVFI